ncbi:MAG: hypothetical protein JWM14_1730 [Chitinophagaceae bacterium]|nr:hypothetical protein [Chitinophagaceae bacterium]
MSYHRPLSTYFKRPLPKKVATYFGKRFNGKKCFFIFCRGKVRLKVFDMISQKSSLPKETWDLIAKMSEDPLLARYLLQIKGLETSNNELHYL